MSLCGKPVRDLVARITYDFSGADESAGCRCRPRTRLGGAVWRRRPRRYTMPRRDEHVRSPEKLVVGGPRTRHVRVLRRRSRSATARRRKPCFLRSQWRGRSQRRPVRRAFRRFHFSFLGPLFVARARLPIRGILASLHLALAGRPLGAFLDIQWSFAAPFGVLRISLRRSQPFAEPQLDLRSQRWSQRRRKPRLFRSELPVLAQRHGGHARRWSHQLSLRHE
jgi:hypothetical protein